MAEVKLYTAFWCGHCHRLKFQLKRAGIPFREIDIEERPEVSDRIVGQTGGYRVIPAVEVGQTLLVNPRLDEIRGVLEAGGAASAN